MEQLWAPWRMRYIQGDDDARGCLFCEAAAHPDEAHYVVHRGPHTLVMLNLYPYNSGHLMIAPYQHTGQIAALRADVGAAMLHTAQLSIRVLDEVMHPDGYNVGINQGTVAGAGIADHIHLHVVPRWGGDTNFMPVLAETKVMPELLLTTAERLRPVFARLAAA